MRPPGLVSILSGQARLDVGPAGNDSQLFEHVVLDSGCEGEGRSLNVLDFRQVRLVPAAAEAVLEVRLVEVDRERPGDFRCRANIGQGTLQRPVVGGLYLVEAHSPEHPVECSGRAVPERLESRS